MKNKVFFVFAALIIWNFVPAPAHAQSNLLPGRTWKLQSINGNNVPGAGAVLEFDLQQGRFSGSGGCNRIFGQVKAGQSTIRFSGVGITRRACPSAEASKTESRFSSALGAVRTYRIVRDALFLYSGKTELLVFNGADDLRMVPDRVGLDEKKWVLDSIGKDRVGKVEQQPFIVFNPSEGSVGGNTGCNLFSGTYTVTGSTMKIDKGISTMRACIEDPTNLEQRFSDALEKVDRFDLRGMTLSLYNGKSLLMSFNGTKKD